MKGNAYWDIIQEEDLINKWLEKFSLVPEVTGHISDNHCETTYNSSLYLGRNPQERKKSCNSLLAKVLPQILLYHILILDLQIGVEPKNFYKRQNIHGETSPGEEQTIIKKCFKCFSLQFRINERQHKGHKRQEIIISGFKGPVAKVYHWDTKNNRKYYWYQKELRVILGIPTDKHDNELPDENIFIITAHGHGSLYHPEKQDTVCYTLAEARDEKILGPDVVTDVWDESWRNIRRRRR